MISLIFMFFESNHLQIKVSHKLGGYDHFDTPSGEAQACAVMVGMKTPDPFKIFLLFTFPRSLILFERVKSQHLQFTLDWVVALNYTMCSVVFMFDQISPDLLFKAGVLKVFFTNIGEKNW